MSEDRRAWTAEDIPMLRAALALTGFPCALQAIKQLEKAAAEAPANEERAA